MSRGDRHARGRHITGRRPTRLTAWTRRVAVLAALALMLWWHRNAGATAAIVMFIASGGMLLVILSLAAVEQNWSRRPLPDGRVVAVVPVYNEDPDRLTATIRSLLTQTRPLDALYVVDDGSTVPATPYRDPRVTWIRTTNQGKRHAQITGLGRELRDADFILTVDSDSVVNSRAVHRLLQAFADPRTMAATGLQVVLNRTESLVTRVTDLEMVYGEMTIRKARSTLGAVCPCGGALSMYRARVIADNVDDYLTSGTYSDDRRLAHYGLAAGRVVSVHDAVVETHMPPTVAGAYRQRLRWFKGAWRYAPWEARNLRGAPLALRLWNFTAWIAYPLTMAWSLIVNPLLGHGVHLAPIGYWLLLLYIQSAVYVTARPRLHPVKRLAAWLFLTPVLSLFQLFVVRPAMYAAVTQTRTTSWVTRDLPAGSQALTAAAP